MAKRKVVILIGDGMGDLPVPELDHKTPLQHANTSAMDYLSVNGELALLKTVPDGLDPGSDVANLSLLGYRPEKFYTGRAPLEAASMGIELADDEIAFRCNLVTLAHQSDSVTMVDYSGGHIGTGDARELIAALKEQLDSDIVTFYPGISYRHLLVVKGECPIATTPPHDHTGHPVTKFWQRYLDSSLADVVLKAGEILADHPVNHKRSAAGERPANAIWLWGQGQTPTITPLTELYGVRGALISAVDLLKGIGVCAGLDIVNVPGATGYIDTNYQGKVDAAIAVLEKDNFVVIHVEAPDETAHQGSLSDKLVAIEDFDRKVVKPIHTYLADSGADYRLVVAMDHFTPISTQTHDRQAVPVIIYDPNGKIFSGLSYCEENALQTGLVYDNGEAFFKRLMG